MSVSGRPIKFITAFRTSRFMLSVAVVSKRMIFIKIANNTKTCVDDVYK